MTDQPTSGNRWERPADKPAPPVDEPAATGPAAAETDEPGPTAGHPTAPQRSPWRKRLTRSRIQLAGVAVVIFLVGGGAGFAVGSTSSGGHDGRGDFPDGFPGGRHFRHDGGGFGGPSGRIPPPRKQGQERPFVPQSDGADT